MKMGEKWQKCKNASTSESEDESGRREEGRRLNEEKEVFISSFSFIHLSPLSVQ